jgi:hypothetical protein
MAFFIFLFFDDLSISHNLNPGIGVEENYHSNTKD